MKNSKMIWLFLHTLIHEDSIITYVSIISITILSFRSVFYFRDMEEFHSLMKKKSSFISKCLPNCDRFYM